MKVLFKVDPGQWSGIFKSLFAQTCSRLELTFVSNYLAVNRIIFSIPMGRRYDMVVCATDTYDGPETEAA